MTVRLIIIFVAMIALLAIRGVAAAHAESAQYGLRYDLTLRPAEDRAEVSITLDGRIKGKVWWLRFHIDPKRHTGFAGDGQIEAGGDYVKWTPPESGGKFSFHLPLNHQRENGKHDARMTPDFAVFRGDDLFPAAHVHDRDDAHADATLHVHLPEGWSFATAYPEVEGARASVQKSVQKGQAPFASQTSQKKPVPVFAVNHAHRRFDRPTGWMAAGKLGVRRERIAGVRVIVAGPMNEGVRRLDTLALLQWTLPRLKRIVPNMPKRILVVSAGDPMFRGGLSGPNSLFVHADRPLLSENGSSTLVHELVHVANRLEAEKGADWIVEGLAEYYSLKLLWRSGTLSYPRYKAAFLKYEEWGNEAERLDADASRGPITARAVVIMRKLDREIYKKTKHKKSLDEVHELLVAAGEKVSLERLRKAVEQVMGEPVEAISEESLRL